MAVRYKVSEDKSRFVEPDGDAEIDVVNDMAWTKTPKSGRKDVPWAYMREYQMQQGQLISSILYWARIYQQVGLSGQLIYDVNDPSDVYKFKYFAKKTGFSYKFPYFSTKKFNRASSFSYEDGKSPFAPFAELGQHTAAIGHLPGAPSGLFRSAAAMGASVGAFAGVALGIGNMMTPGKIEMEHPRAWTGTQESDFVISFDLLNTGSVQDVEDNRNLCYILTHNNSGSRRSFSLMDPSCIYDLYIPDVVSFPACYISNLDITNLGNTRIRQLSNGIDRIIPEAYRINMTISSLLLPTRNILMGLDSGQPVVTIGNANDEASIFNRLLQNFQPNQQPNQQGEINRSNITVDNPLLPNSTPLSPISQTGPNIPNQDVNRSDIRVPNPINP
jgi:hypothetical protein